MARPRQPIDLIVAKGKKNLTKAEIAERRATEVTPCADDLTAPSYLTAKQKKHFDKLAAQLVKIKIMGETDVETLARYVTAQALYEEATKELRAVVRNRPKCPVEEDGENLSEDDVRKLLIYQERMKIWYLSQDVVAKLQDRYFKQAQAAAAALGLTISSRCKLIAPVKDEAPKQNKFAKFGTEAAGDE